ncbi:MAG: hypothetical protein AAB396_00070 [Patescibacteria group bacterium]
MWGINIIKDKYLRVVFALSFLVLIFALAEIFLQFNKLSVPLIIHFDTYRGIDFLGGKMEIFGILISSFIAIFINFIFSNFFYYRERFISYGFGLTSLGLSVLILIAVSVIMTVN